uniref:ShKT domain-containing protein n=1 Tax=Strongyloides stercoralis TaxID=6248 RepID=A0A0K0E8B0_STRER
MKYYFFITFLFIILSSQCFSDIEADCKKNKTLCKNTDLKLLIKEYYTLTNNSFNTVTIPSDCIDLGYGCNTIKQYCQDTRYTPIMKENCAKTCGFCHSSTGTTPIPLDCSDKSHLCVSLKYFCKVQLFKEVMDFMCPKTCEFCY